VKHGSILRTSSKNRSVRGHSKQQRSLRQPRCVQNSNRHRFTCRPTDVSGRRVLRDCDRARHALLSSSFFFLSFSPLLSLSSLCSEDGEHPDRGEAAFTAAARPRVHRKGSRGDGCAGGGDDGGVDDRHSGVCRSLRRSGAGAGQGAVSFPRRRTAVRSQQTPAANRRTWAEGGGSKDRKE